MHDKADPCAETLEVSKQQIEDNKADLKEITQASNESGQSQMQQTQESSIVYQKSAGHERNDSMVDIEEYPLSSEIDIDVMLGFGTGKPYDELLKIVYKGAEDEGSENEDDNNDHYEEALFGKLFANFKDDLMPDFERVPPKLQVIGRDLPGLDQMESISAMITQSSVPEVIKYPSTEHSRDYPPLHLYDINEAAKSRNMRNLEFEPKCKNPKFRPWY